MNKVRRIDQQVHVTADDIARGVALKSAQCPVTRAVTRTFPWASNVYTEGGLIKLADSAERIRYIGELPAVAYKGVRDFDDGEGMLPFSFRLTLAALPMHTRQKPRTKEHATKGKTLVEISANAAERNRAAALQRIADGKPVKIVFKTGKRASGNRIMQYMGSTS